MNSKAWVNLGLAGIVVAGGAAALLWERDRAEPGKPQPRARALPSGSAAPEAAPEPVPVPAIAIPPAIPEPSAAAAVPSGSGIDPTRLGGFSVSLEDAMAWFSETHPLPPGVAERLQALLRQELDDYTREAEDWVAGQQVLLPGLSPEDILGMESRQKDFAALRQRVRARYTDALKGTVPEAAWPAFSRALRHEGSAIRVDKDGKILLDWDYAKRGGWMRVQPRGVDSEAGFRIARSVHDGKYAPLRSAAKEAGMTADQERQAQKALGNMAAGIARFASGTTSLEEVQGMKTATETLHSLLGPEKAQALINGVKAELY